MKQKEDTVTKDMFDSIPDEVSGMGDFFNEKNLKVMATKHKSLIVRQLSQIIIEKNRQLATLTGTKE